MGREGCLRGMGDASLLVDGEGEVLRRVDEAADSPDEDALRSWEPLSLATSPSSPLLSSTNETSRLFRGRIVDADVLEVEPPSWRDGMDEGSRQFVGSPLLVIPGPLASTAQTNGRRERGETTYPVGRRSQVRTASIELCVSRDNKAT